MICKFDSGTFFEPTTHVGVFETFSKIIIGAVFSFFPVVNECQTPIFCVYLAWRILFWFSLL